MVWLVFVQTYSNVPEPFTTERSMDPVAVPQEDELTVVANSSIWVAGSVTTEAEGVKVQPFSSVTVTLYVPATSPVMVEVVAPVDHE